MPNYSDRVTDAELAKLEKQIKQMYKKASKELGDAVDQYWNGYTDKNGIWHDGFGQRYMKEYQAYQDGAYTEQQWHDWVQAQIGRGKRIEEMQNQATDRMLNANSVAISYVNDKTPGIYSLNHNYSLYQINSVHPNASFSLVDENTVKRLMEKKNHVNFRILRQNHTADYKWNKSKITNALTQGMLQGEGPADISKRFMQVMGSNEKAAIRNARTSFTSAQNGGRIDSYEKASAQGIEIEKEWLATSDGRTRPSHVHANGQRKPWNKPFELEFGEMNYPGDPAGHPAEVYNCRCTVVPVLPKYSVDEGFDDWLNSRKLGYVIKDGNEKWSIDWPKKGKNITSAQNRELKEYADKAGIKLDGFKKSDVDIDLTKHMIDKISYMFDQFPELKDYTGKSFVFRTTSNHDTTCLGETFPKTPHILEINMDALRNREKLEDEYKQFVEIGAFVNGTGIDSIIYHEFGHLFDYKYNVDSIEIMKDVLGKTNKAEVLKWCKKNLSEYSSDFADGTEIISECFSAYFGTKNPKKEIVDFMNKCFIIRKKGC